MGGETLTGRMQKPEQIAKWDDPDLQHSVDLSNGVTLEGAIGMTLASEHEIRGLSVGMNSSAPHDEYPPRTAFAGRGEVHVGVEDYFEKRRFEYRAEYARQRDGAIVLSNIGVDILWLDE